MGHRGGKCMGRKRCQRVGPPLKCLHTPKGTFALASSRFLARKMGRPPESGQRSSFRAGETQALLLVHDHAVSTLKIGTRRVSFAQERCYW